MPKQYQNHLLHHELGRGPCLESAAKAEATSNYAGSYSVLSSCNSSMTVAKHSDPGFSVTNRSLAGVDILPLVIKLGGSDVKTDSKISVRLYPTGLKNTKAGKVTAVAWGAVFQLIPYVYVVDPAAVA
jgi:hypothetical protein